MRACSRTPQENQRTRGDGEPAAGADTVSGSVLGHPLCFGHITRWLLPTLRDPLPRSRPPAGRRSSALAPSTRSAAGAQPGPASCLFRELGTRTRRASSLPSPQTAHSPRGTDLTSPQTLEQPGERFRESSVRRSGIPDFNTTVRNTIRKPLNIGDLGSPQSTPEEPGRHPGGVRDSGREGPGQAGTRGLRERAVKSTAPSTVAKRQHYSISNWSAPKNALPAASREGAPGTVPRPSTNKTPATQGAASPCQAGTSGRRVCTAAVDARPPEGE